MIKWVAMVNVLFLMKLKTHEIYHFLIYISDPCKLNKLTLSTFILKKYYGLIRLYNNTDISKRYIEYY